MQVNPDLQKFITNVFYFLVPCYLIHVGVTIIYYLYKSPSIPKHDKSSISESWTMPYVSLFLFPSSLGSLKFLFWCSASDPLISTISSFFWSAKLVVAKGFLCTPSFSFLFNWTADEHKFLLIVHPSLCRDFVLVNTLLVKLQSLLFLLS